MKLRQEVIERIRGRKDVGLQIAIAMGVNKASVNKWLRDNKDNSPLTSFAVVTLLETELNLTPDQIILDGTAIPQNV